MAQFDLTEEVEHVHGRQPGEIRFDEVEIETTNVMTGDKDQSRHLYYQLKKNMQTADGIDILVSFLMESGVKLICEDLKAALERGARIRILTGNYLGITQPSALYMLKRELGDGIDLRFYNDKSRSFHPKAYIFHEGDKSDIYIGSSNISRSAMTSGIEWNYRFTNTSDPENYQLFYQTFEDLFYHHSIVVDDEEPRRYSKNWHKPALAKDLERYDEVELINEENPDHDDKFDDRDSLTSIQPRGAQIEALYALEDSRAEGATKALVQAATGVGKTYLAAFDSAPYPRVLFVAHREEILQQAARSFANVRRSDDYGFFTGKQKDTDKSVIFASVATLGKPEYLCRRYFAPDYFDYIIIDEFHHAVTDQYRRIVDYFTPQFLLGLTATPDRLDGKNIYELCDYNVPFEISLKEAINKGLLVPFHYYGIYDETDYSGLRLVNGHYDEKDLTDLYQENQQRIDLIYKYYSKYHPTRALGFCCSRQHAEEMAREFCDRGVPAVAVYSNADSEYALERDKAIQQLKDGEISVIFCVDMFNEGLDIDSLDMVMFLRPTESPTVFLQQLGRGLRTCKGKDHLTVLDFIGNYAKAGNAPRLLSGETSCNAIASDEYAVIEYPDDCIVDFDMQLIDLFKELEKKAQPMRRRIDQEYDRVKARLGGKVPTRMELFTYMDDDVYEYCIRHTHDNPFRHYLTYLHDRGELNAAEQVLYDGIAREFLEVLETTDMTKVYKMPVLSAFYNGGDIRMAVTDDEVLMAWKAFFDTDTNWKDLASDMTYDDYKAMTDKQHLNKARTMPIKYLKASGKGFFIDKDGYALAIRDDLEPFIHNPSFSAHMGDILTYRTMEYYRKRYRSR